MNEARFDALTRSIDGVQTRRLTVQRSLAALAALGGGLAARSAAAKKNKRKKKKCKKPSQPSCAAACHGACDFCFTRAAGPLLCGSISGGGVPPCDTPCFSDNDCVGLDQPYCVTQIEDRETGQTQQPCTDPGGWCFSFSSCGA
jgi:hypothetical protein